MEDCVSKGDNTIEIIKKSISGPFIGKGKAC